MSHFRHFCRGGYAIFASLHREVIIGVLSVGVLASVNIPKVEAKQVAVQPHADTDTEEEADDKDMAEIAVTGTMSPLTAMQAARIVGVITRQQIEASPAQSVNDLLKLVAGVDVRQRGGFGIQTDISIDGSTFDQISLLLNGVNITSPHTGHLAADFPVSPNDIERIEILEGAASRVYGSSAFGGAINIVTKRPTPDPYLEGGEASGEKAKRISFEAGVQGGSYLTLGGDAHVYFCKTRKSAGLPSLTGGVGGGYLRSNGATPNSDFWRYNLFHSGCLDADDYKVEWQAGYSQKAYCANTFYSAAYPNQFESNRRLITSLSAESKGRIRVRPEVYWIRSYDHFQLIRGTATGENFHRTDVHGARITASVGWQAGRTALGAEVREEGIYSTTLGQPLQNKSGAPKVPGEDVFYSCHDTRTNISINAEHTLLLPRFTASVGLLANYNTRFDSGLSFYPGIDLAFTPSSHWRLFASYNKGFRLPTFTDLYYKSPTHEGNIGMKAEESHSFQIATKANYQFSIFNFQFSTKLFYHRGKRLIDWVMYEPGDVYHSANFDLDNMGVEATVNCQLPSVSCQLSYTFIHQRRYDEIAIYKSNYAMEYLRHKLVAILDQHIWKYLSASLTLRWQDRTGSYIYYENAHSIGELVEYKPCTILDLKVRWAAPRYEVWAEATNLTNKTYYDLGNIPQPGIVVLGGIRCRF